MTEGESAPIRGASPSPSRTSSSSTTSPSLPPSEAQHTTARRSFTQFAWDGQVDGATPRNGVDGLGDAAAALGGPEEEGSVHLEDHDTLAMPEVIRAAEHAQDPLVYLEQEGLVKLGQLEVDDALALTAFSAAQGPWAGRGGLLVMTTGHEHATELDWRTMWRSKLERTHAPRAQWQDTGWTSTMQLEAFVITVSHAAAEGSRGVLQPLLRRYRARGVPRRVFALPAVQAVIAFKWASFGRACLVAEVCLYVLWLAMHCAFSLLLIEEDDSLSLRELIASSRGMATVACSVVAAVMAAPFAYCEARVAAAQRSAWLGVANVADVISYILQAVLCWLHLARYPLTHAWFSVLLATQHVLLWSKLQNYARVSQNVGGTNARIVDIVCVVLHETRHLLWLLAITMLGFGFAFYVMFKQDRLDGEEMAYQDHTSLAHSIASMFMYLVAMFDLNVFYNSSHPLASTVLFLVYEAVTAILLLNVLVAAMVSSYDKVRENEAVRVLTHQAQYLGELEAVLPRWAKRAAWSPVFVHVLAATPRQAQGYEVDPRSLWTGTQRLEDTLLAAQRDTHARASALEARVEALTTRMADALSLAAELAAATGCLGGPAPGAPPRPSHRDDHPQGHMDSHMGRQVQTGRTPLSHRPTWGFPEASHPAPFLTPAPGARWPGLSPLTPAASQPVPAQHAGGWGGWGDSSLFSSGTLGPVPGLELGAEAEGMVGEIGGWPPREVGLPVGVWNAWEPLVGVPEGEAVLSVEPGGVQQLGEAEYEEPSVHHVVPASDTQMDGGSTTGGLGTGEEALNGTGPSSGASSSQQHGRVAGPPWSATPFSFPPIMEADASPEWDANQAASAVHAAAYGSPPGPAISPVAANPPSWPVVLRTEASAEGGVPEAHGGEGGTSAAAPSPHPTPHHRRVGHPAPDTHPLPPVPAIRKPHSWAPAGHGVPAAAGAMRHLPPRTAGALALGAARGAVPLSALAALVRPATYGMGPGLVAAAARRSGGVAGAPVRRGLQVRATGPVPPRPVRGYVPVGSLAAALGSTLQLLGARAGGGGTQGAAGWGVPPQLTEGGQVRGADEDGGRTSRPHPHAHHHHHHYPPHQRHPHPRPHQHTAPGSYRSSLEGPGPGAQGHHPPAVEDVAVEGGDAGGSAIEPRDSIGSRGRGGFGVYGVYAQPAASPGPAGGLQHGMSAAEGRAAWAPGGWARVASQVNTVARIRARALAMRRARAAAAAVGAGGVSGTGLSAAGGGGPAPSHHPSSSSGGEGEGHRSRTRGAAADTAAVLGPEGQEGRSSPAPHISLLIPEAHRSRRHHTLQSQHSEEGGLGHSPASDHSSSQHPHIGHRYSVTYQHAPGVTASLSTTSQPPWRGLVGQQLSQGASRGLVAGHAGSQAAGRQLPAHQASWHGHAGQPEWAPHSMHMGAAQSVMQGPGLVPASTAGPYAPNGAPGDAQSGTHSLVRSYSW